MKLALIEDKHIFYIFEVVKKLKIECNFLNNHFRTGFNYNGEKYENILFEAIIYLPFTWINFAGCIFFVI